MGLRQTSRAEGEPITLDEAKDHLRVNHSAEDGVIGGFLSAARGDAESYTTLAFAECEWEQTLDGFPRGPIELQRGPVEEVTEITYVDGDGVTQVLDPALYVVDLDSAPARVAPAVDESWPATARTLAAVRIAFTGGIADAVDVPPEIVNAIKLRLADLYFNREGAAMTGTSAFERLLNPFRVWSF